MTAAANDAANNIWDPAQYLKFADERTRPALDLLARVPAETPESVADLGCGAGNVTRLLAARWPGAQIVGVDSSDAMLAKARAQLPDATFVRGDLARWRPGAPLDVLYSNAALHWLSDHARLFPALMETLKPGGVLAVQMPRPLEQPSHVEMAKAAEAGPWRTKAVPALPAYPRHAVAEYHDWLNPLSRGLDIWETIYTHALKGEDAVVEWTKGAALSPVLAALADKTEREGFLAEYKKRLRAAYPPRADGTTLFPFRRLFIVAAK
ncbi:MAG: trans-aconitate 2-methyltransferase [Alphaproteobacteria bacterium]|nr:trans-aconitate 2-methyltransferase [Alphaproteobacteria bacterium]